MTGEASDVGDFIIFRAANRLCALPIEHVIETMRPLAIEPVAGMAAVMLGLSVVRGIAVPVVDAGVMIGVDVAAEITRFIVLRMGARRVCLAVESILGIRAMARTSLRRLPLLLGQAGSEVFAATGTLDTELLLVLQVVRVLTDDMLDAILPIEART